MLQPCFFATSSGEQLFGVHRGTSSPGRIWIVCPPFGEEDKSARRALTELCLALNQHGDDTFLFSYRGTGDSAGNFATATLDQWTEDIRAAALEAGRRAPGAAPALLGVRLGASLALRVADELGASCHLVEPLINGRSFLMQQTARKKLRAQLTTEEGREATVSQPVTPTPLPAGEEIEDLDGWPLGQRLRQDLKALDLRLAAAPRHTCHLYQVGPRPEVSGALQALGDALHAEVHAVVMPAFWNLLDYASPQPLISRLCSAAFAQD